MVCLRLVMLLSHPCHRSAGLGRTRLCHPWAHEPERGGRAPAFRVARCQTPPGVKLDGFGWVSLGPVRARQGPLWSRMGLYVSRALIRESRVIRRDSSGPVGPCRVPMGFRRNPDLACRDPSGLTGRSTVPYRCTIDVRTPWARHDVPTGPPGPRRDPTGTGGPPAAPSDPA